MRQHIGQSLLLNDCSVVRNIEIGDYRWINTRYALAQQSSSLSDECNVAADVPVYGCNRSTGVLQYHGDLQRAYQGLQQQWYRYPSLRRCRHSLPGFKFRAHCIHFGNVCLCGFTICIGMVLLCFAD